MFKWSNHTCAFSHDLLESTRSGEPVKYQIDSYSYNMRINITSWTHDACISLFMPIFIFLINFRALLIALTLTWRQSYYQFCACVFMVSSDSRKALSLHGPCSMWMSHVVMWMHVHLFSYQFPTTQLQFWFKDSSQVASTMKWFGCRSKWIEYYN